MVCTWYVCPTHTWIIAVCDNSINSELKRLVLATCVCVSEQVNLTNRICVSEMSSIDSGKWFVVCSAPNLRCQKSHRPQILPETKITGRRIRWSLPISVTLQLGCLFNNLFNIPSKEISKLPITSPLWEQSIGHRWISLAKSPYRTEGQ